ncbi:Crp/Fnr family transcriptional regulator [Acidiphilium sp.]|uniref:Crp/Fnr family transcriptional regulator n=1 Tax=Acidiphilium sp. TaxID=527 RepID=UPI003D046EEE
MGPSIYAIPLSGSSTMPRQLLTVDERRKLALIASIRRFSPGEFLFHEGEPATVIFNIIAGVAKSVSSLEDGRQAVVAFFFSHDLVGMFEASRYAQSTQAVTALTAYCLPIDALERMLRHDPNLQLHFLCKVSHELRAAQHQAIALGRYGALQKIGLFLDFLDRHPDMHTDDDDRITIPMDRADIADHVGLTIESVSRMLQQLHRTGVIQLDGRHRFRIINRCALNRLISGAMATDATLDAFIPEHNHSNGHTS